MNYHELLQLKEKTEKRIERLKTSYFRRFLNSSEYYNRYEKLGLKLMEIEKAIIQKYPNKSLSP